MTLTIKIKMDNAAFEKNSGTEIARLLRYLATEYDERDLLRGELEVLRDPNGNRVGEAKVTR